MSTSFESGIAYVSDPIAESQERTRVLLALSVMALLLFVVLGIFIYISTNEDHESAELMLTGILTPIIGVSGTVLGFYFGSPNT
jgi:hypothetical protein